LTPSLDTLNEGGEMKSQIKNLAGTFCDPEIVAVKPSTFRACNSTGTRADNESFSQ
jgi:hypothetical protein